MMHDKDWELLEKAWKERPSDWREHCAYILGCGSLADCMPISLDRSRSVAHQF
jgi:hypothetical protein